MKYLLKVSVLLALLTGSWGRTYAFIEEDGTAPITQIIKYSPDVEQVMLNRCVTCHGGAAPSDGLDLTTYQNVKFSTEKSKLIERINDVTNPMPPNGLMSARERAIMQKWVDDGFLQQ